MNNNTADLFAPTRMPARGSSTARHMPPAPSSRAVRHLKPLTSFRILAALFVFLSHIGYLLGTGRDVAGQLNLRIFQQGYVGVTFFFVLSGFILTYTSQYSDLTGPARRAFYINRCARIYPVHLATFALMLPVVLPDMLRHAGGWHALGIALLNLSLLHAFVPDKLNTAFSINGVAWSISAEMFFYALFPTLLGLARRRTSPQLLLAMAGVWGTVFALAWLMRHNGTYWFWYINPFIRLGDFAVGIMAGCLYLRAARRIGVLPRATAWELASVLLCALCFVWHPWQSPIARASFFFLPGFTAVIFVFAFGQGALSRLLARPWLVYFGEASFSFYMVHYFWVVLAGKHWLPEMVRQPVAAIAALLALSLASSVLLYQYGERPLRDRLRQALRHRLG